MRNHHRKEVIRIIYHAKTETITKQLVINYHRPDAVNGPKISWKAREMMKYDYEVKKSRFRMNVARPLRLSTIISVTSWMFISWKVYVLRRIKVNCFQLWPFKKLLCAFMPVCDSLSVQLLISSFDFCQNHCIKIYYLTIVQQLPADSWLVSSDDGPRCPWLSLESADGNHIFA